MGRDMFGILLGVVVEGVLVVGVVVVGAGVVVVVPVVEPPFACPKRGMQQAVVRRIMRAQFRIKNLRIQSWLHYGMGRQGVGAQNPLFNCGRTKARL